MSECAFCNPESIRTGLLDQTPNFYHRANVKGSMAPGHSMIISKAHLPCYGSMPRFLDDEYLNFKEQIQKRVANAFADPIMIEQGIHGQSVFHAHTHFLPSVSEWYNFSNGTRFIDLVPEKIKVTPCKSLDDLKNIFEREGQYVSIEENGQLYVCHTVGYEGLLRPVREFPARLSGISHLLHWQTMPDSEKKKNEQWVTETITKLHVSK